MSLGNWRQVDVDQYDDNVYTQDEILDSFDTGVPAAEVESATRTRSSEVNSLITRGDLTSALLRALEDPPYGRHYDTAKSISTKTVIDVLVNIQTGDILETIKSLQGDEQRDLLMKYLYAGMAEPALYNVPVLLAWHEVLTNTAGIGCIARVMADKRTLI